MKHAPFLIIVTSLLVVSLSHAQNRDVNPEWEKNIRHRLNHMLEEKLRSHTFEQRVDERSAKRTAPPGGEVEVSGHARSESEIHAAINPMDSAHIVIAPIQEVSGGGSTGGGWSCSVAGLLPGDNVTATVTDGLGNTSEFSQIHGPIVPVEWVSIHAAWNDGIVWLRWITATECNNAFFEIERRAGTSAWRCVGTVPGSGTTNTERLYTFADPLRDLGGETLLRYRITQVDYDGTRDSSPETFVELVTAPSVPVFDPAWPNPGSDHVFLRFTLPVEAEVRLSLSDVCGREVVHVPSPAFWSAGSGTLRIDTETLPSGIYQLVCRAGDLCEVQWVRIVK